MNYPARIAAREETVAITADEYVEMVRTDAFGGLLGKVELVGGVLEQMMPAHFGHGEYNIIIGAALHAAYRDTRFGTAIDLMIRIDDYTVRAADVAITLPDPPRDGAVPAAHILLAVEVVDTSENRDLVEKPDDYARGGVAHYWAIDINNRVAHVFGEPEDGVYKSRSLASFGNTLIAPKVGTPIPLD